MHQYVRRQSMKTQQRECENPFKISFLTMEVKSIETSRCVSVSLTTPWQWLISWFSVYITPKSRHNRK